MTRLENWGTIPDPNADPYLAPELRSVLLIGEVYDHPNFRITDGERITTSSISGQGPVDGSCVTAGGTVYELGEPDPAYERLYPNAKERFFTTLRLREAA